MLKLGVHVTKTSKVWHHDISDSVKKNMNKYKCELARAIIRDVEELGLNCAQIFTHGPRNKNKSKIDEKEIIAVTDDIDLSVHGSYLSVSVWKADSPDSKYLSHIKDQLNACRDIGAWGLVLHVTKQTPKNVAAVMSYLKPIAEKTDVVLILEMVSSKADSKTYENPEKINNVTKLIEEKAPGKWWVWCVDTAHLWGAGVDIKSKQAMDNWLNGLLPSVLSRVGMFHLNGSSAIRGSGKDKHEVLFKSDDLIWKDVKPQQSGAAAVIKFCVKKKITIICEINRGTTDDIIDSIELIKNLA